jgi:hypothetical protein
MGNETGEDATMAFAEGQQVRVKRGELIGIVARKLAHLQDMYVIEVNGDHKPGKKLAHESDLELLKQTDERRSA